MIRLAVALRVTVNADRLLRRQMLYPSAADALTLQLALQYVWLDSLEDVGYRI